MKNKLILHLRLHFHFFFSFTYRLFNISGQILDSSLRKTYFCVFVRSQIVVNRISQALFRIWYVNECKLCVLFVLKRFHEESPKMFHRHLMRSFSKFRYYSNIDITTFSGSILINWCEFESDHFPHYEIVTGLIQFNLLL